MKKLVLLFLALLLFVSSIGIPAIIVYGESNQLLECQAQSKPTKNLEKQETNTTFDKYNSKQSLLMDFNTGKVIFEKNSKQARPIASMVKIMTLLCIYDAISQGKITLDTEIIVSPYAASMGGSQVFLSANSVHKVQNLIQSIIICSANDSCVALAEHISGSVESFVKLMNDKANKLKLVNTHFTNCTGLPTTEQFSCSIDVATMMRELITNENFFECSKIWMKDYLHPDGRTTGMTNTNKLVRFYSGCDGGKTGYTAEAMHCLCATAKRQDSRFIAVVIGAEDSKSRFAEISKMFDYAFANYESYIYLNKTQEINVDVSGGKVDKLSLFPQKNLALFGKKGQTKGEIVIDLPTKVCSPVKRGDIIGYAILQENGSVIDKTELIASCDISSKSYFDCVRELIKNW
ncbi:MAG: D-alanyl-D-alanine carboxypeptidase family protein [Clostridia bacterium]